MHGHTQLSVVNQTQGSLHTKDASLLTELHPSLGSSQLRSLGAAGPGSGSHVCFFKVSFYVYVHACGYSQRPKRHAGSPGTAPCGVLGTELQFSGGERHALASK